MKKMLYLIGGSLLMLFALVFFFEFFLAWNLKIDMAYMMYENSNFQVDMRISFSMNEHYYMYHFPSRFTFSNMLDNILARRDGASVKGFVIFTRENWLQLCIFLAISVMVTLKVFAPKLISKKAIGLAFVALAVLAAWVLVKSFVEQWRHMFGNKATGSMQHWQQYVFGNREVSKFRVILCVVLHAGQNLLLVAAFGAMAAVFMSPSFKKMFFVPAGVVAVYAALMLICNLTGWGFALKWSFISALIFLIVDGLLAAGLFVMGLAAKSE